MAFVPPFNLKASPSRIRKHQCGGSCLSVLLKLLVLLLPFRASSFVSLLPSKSGTHTDVQRAADLHRTGKTNVRGLCSHNDVQQDYSWMDVVIVMVAPVCTTKEVVSTLRYNFQFRRVFFIVKDERFCPYLREMAEDGYVVCLDENKVLPGVTHKSLYAESDGLIRNSQQSNRVGWYLQQYLKLGVALHIDDLSEYYLVWDADNLSSRPFDLFHGVAENGRRRASFCANPVTHKSTSYAKFYQQMMGEPLLRPSGLVSLEATIADSRVPGRLHNFVCGYMVMYRPHVKEMLSHASDVLRERYRHETRGFPWDLHALANELVPNAWFSEYDTYGSFVRTHYPDEFHVDYGLLYNRNAEAAVGGGGGGKSSKGGKAKGGADDAPAKFSCCLTHKRICALSRAPSATEQLAGKSASSSKSSSLTDGVHIVIWEEHKMRYRGTSSQCTDLMPAALESAIKEVGHGVTLASAKKFDSKS